MLNTLRRRFPLAEVILAPCAVQGDEAPPEIVRALEQLNRLSPAPDVILLARGGGSLEDLWAFNDERVVRAVAASAVPVITGVGHETDFTLSDFAADQRAPTPTAAAEMATPDIIDLRAWLRGLTDRLQAAELGLASGCRGDLAYLQTRLEQASPQRRIQNDRQRLDELELRMGRALAGRLALQSALLKGLGHRLEALNPQAVMQRGFAIVRDETGRVVRSPAQLTAGQAVDVRLAQGGFTARVEKLESQTGEQDA